MVLVTYCKKCGRKLKNKKCIEEGIGIVCKKKSKVIDKNNYTLNDYGLD